MEKMYRTDTYPMMDEWSWDAACILACSILRKNGRELLSSIIYNTVGGDPVAIELLESIGFDTLKTYTDALTPIKNILNRIKDKTGIWYRYAAWMTSMDCIRAKYEAHLHPVYDSIYSCDVEDPCVLEILECGQFYFDGYFDQEIYLYLFPKEKKPHWKLERKGRRYYD